MAKRSQFRRQPRPKMSRLSSTASGISTKSRNECRSFCVDVGRCGRSVERGVYAAGAVYEKGKFSIGAIDYYSDDIINIAYAEAKMELPFSRRLAAEACRPIRRSAQCRRRPPAGRRFSGQQFGLKAELPVKKALFTAAYTQAMGDTNMQNPWSGYPGYTSVQVQDFNRAGESAFLLRAGYDFPWVTD